MSLVQGSRCGSISFFCNAAIPFDRRHLLKKLVFLQCVLLAPLSQLKCLEVCRIMSVPSILLHWSMYVSTPLPCWSSYQSSIIQLKIWNCDASGNSFIIPDWFNYCELLCFHMKFKIFMWRTMLEFWWGLHWMCRLLFRKMAIFTMLILPTHEHEQFLHLLMPLQFLSPVS